MLRYLLDTNIVIYVLKRRPVEVLSVFNQNASRMAISAITLSELYHGAEKSSKVSENLVTTFEISTPGVDTRVGTLSGGNTQKVILAREISTRPDLLVAVHPTRGLDVGATEAVQKLLLQQREAGAAVLLISEDLDELLAVSDRIAVIFDGQIIGEMPTAEADIEKIGLMMAGTK